MKKYCILLFFSMLTLFNSLAQSAVKSDEYGPVKKADAAARLDNFAVSLMNDPGATGYIITYGGSKSRAGAAKMQADFSKNYLVKTGGLPADRIVAIDGGLQEEPKTELWIVPEGALPPMPSPTVESRPKKPGKPAPVKPKKKS